MKILFFSTFFYVILFAANGLFAQIERDLKEKMPQTTYLYLNVEDFRYEKPVNENNNIAAIAKKPTILSIGQYDDTSYEGIEYSSYNNIMLPAYHIYYETDLEGRETKETKMGLIYGTTDSVVIIKNQNFRFKNWELLDTATYYMKTDDHSYAPYSRLIENHFYFKNFEVDSFYWERIEQRWDVQAEIWIDYLTRRYYYWDTIVEYLYKFEKLYLNDEGIYEKFGFTNDSLIYDDKGFVIAMYQTHYEENNIKTYSKYIFANDETGKPFKITRYFRWAEDAEYQEDIAWVNWKWKEWHAFSFQSLKHIGDELRSPYTKKNKEESYQIVQNGDTIGFYQKWWNTDAFDSKTDTLYYYDMARNKYPVTSYSDFYNDHDDYVSFVLTSWDTWPGGTGSHQKNGHLEYLWDFIYEKPFGKKEEKNYLIGMNDTTFLSHTVKDFSFVGIPAIDSPNDFAFSIAPNPATGYTKIAAQEEIQYIEIFDLTGRLVKTEAVHNQEIIISFDNLSRGVYLLKAVFKKGGARTQKLIVQ